MLIPIRDHNPYHRFPLVTLGIIGLNVFAYLTTVGLFGDLGARESFLYGAVPCDVVGTCERVSAELAQRLPERPPTWATLFTSMFMHANFFHIAGNMLFLWVFGNNVEDRLGHVRFAAFYLVTGLAAAAAHIALNLGSQVPIVGASGAVSGILGAYILLWPRARVVSLVPLGFFFFTAEVPAWLLLGLWFVFQLVSGLYGLGLQQGGGVAFFAHVGGFVAGLLLIKLFAPRRRRPEADWLNW